MVTVEKDLPTYLPTQSLRGESATTNTTKSVFSLGLIKLNIGNNGGKS
jgi:hypothetical protein